MVPMAAERSTVRLLLILAWLGCQVTPARASDTCYSRRKGFEECWNGCCGPAQDQQCCSSIVFIVGISLAVGTALTIVVVLVLCWFCKDSCRPKGCCCCGERGDSRDSASGGGGGGWRRRSQADRRDYYRRRGGGVLVVRPVEPPAYDMISQLRPLPLQQGYTYRNQPVSPPPAYTETAALPPPPTPGQAQPLVSPTQADSAHASATRHAHTTTLAPGGVAILSPPEETNHPLSVADVGQPTVRGFTASHPSSMNNSIGDASRQAQILQPVSQSQEMNRSLRRNSLNANQMLVVQPASVSDGDNTTSSSG